MAEALILAALAMAIVFGPAILSLILWARVRALERTVADLDRRLASPAAEPSPVPVVPARPDAAPFRPSRLHADAAPAPRIAAAPLPPPSSDAARPLPTTATQTGFDWEHLVAGQWLNRIGLVAVAVGVAYFLKYAIDNDWIGPQRAGGVGRPLRRRRSWPRRRGCLKRRLVYFADGVTGLGAAVLYLSLWAAGSYYQLLSPAATFIAMAVVTAAMVAIAAGRRSLTCRRHGDDRRVRGAGRWSAPAGMRRSSSSRTSRFTTRRCWCWRGGGNGGCSSCRLLCSPQAYFLAWYDRFYTSERIVSTSAFAVLFFAQFSAIPVLRSRRVGGVRPEQAAVASLAAFVFLLVLRDMLWPDHRWTLSAVDARARRPVSRRRARRRAVSALPRRAAAPTPSARRNCCLPAWR